MISPSPPPLFDAPLSPSILDQTPPIPEYLKWNNDFDIETIIDDLIKRPSAVLIRLKKQVTLVYLYMDKLAAEKQPSTPKMRGLAMKLNDHINDIRYAIRTSKLITEYLLHWDIVEAITAIIQQTVEELASYLEPVRSNLPVETTGPHHVSVSLVGSNHRTECTTWRPLPPPTAVRI